MSFSVLPTVLSTDIASTCCGDDKRGSNSSLEDLLDIIKQCFCQCRNSRGPVILIVSIHGSNHRFWDVDRPWNKQVIPSWWCIEVVHVLPTKFSTYCYRQPHKQWQQHLSCITNGECLVIYPGSLKIPGRKLKRNYYTNYRCVLLTWIFHIMLFIHLKYGNFLYPKYKNV